jgi:hypothetical protein
MELGQHEMRIALSLAIILVAALVALVCDLLRRNNEQLREFAIELKIRQEEESKRFHMMAPRAALAPASGASNVSAAPAPTSAPGSIAGKPARERGIAARPSTTEGAPKIAAQKTAHRELAETDAVTAAEQPSIAERPKAAERPSVAKRPEREKRALSAEALVVIHKAELLARSPKPRRVPESIHSEAPAPAHFVATHGEPEVKVPVIEVLQASPKPSGASRDWGSLLNGRGQSSNNESNESIRKDTALAATEHALSAVHALPAGFQDGFTLTRLVASRQPVSGLVVSIGASAAQDANRSVSGDVHDLIQSLIGPGDFAAQSGKDEFLLIYPHERGASAQRRLSQIAERLWDFQLHSMGSLPVLFSWGGVEVRSESIDEAIASATERMQETRRSRMLLTMEPRPSREAPLRRAV